MNNSSSGPRSYTCRAAADRCWCVSREGKVSSTLRNLLSCFHCFFGGAWYPRVGIVCSRSSCQFCLDRFSWNCQVSKRADRSETAGNLGNISQTYILVIAILTWLEANVFHFRHREIMLSVHERVSSIGVLWHICNFLLKAIIITLLLLYSLITITALRLLEV